MTDNRVLVVDDEENVRGLIEKILTRAGYQCEPAATAEAALDILEKTPVPVALVDVVLPGMSGLELVARIKDRYDTDVIVITGRAEEHTYGEAIGQGASDFVVKPVRSDELLLRLKRVVEERDMRHTQTRIMRELENLVITDSLTGLYNSRHFHSQIETETGRANRYAHQLSLLILDVDHFKGVNDEFGHVEGDRVLSAIASLIQASIRRTDSAYRYGGEEFTALLPETGGNEASQVAERIRAAIADAEFFEKQEQGIAVTVSIGVAEYKQEEVVSDFVRRADSALYESKQNGRNAVSLDAV